MKKTRDQVLAKNTKLVGTQTIIRPSSTDPGEVDKRKYYNRSRKSRRAQARLASEEYVTEARRPMTFLQMVSLGYNVDEYKEYISDQEKRKMVPRKKRWRDLTEHERLIL